MSENSLLNEFVTFTESLKGDEKGEAQIFCDRLFQAFGHKGINEAGGTLEARIKFSSGKTKFADCLWSPVGSEGVLIEMKKRSVKNLKAHFPQARDYWMEMNPEEVIGKGAQKPTYVILCNFDRFLIYKQLSLVDDISIDEIEDRSSAFNFLLPDSKEPIFKHNVEAISKNAAKTVGELFKYLVYDKKEDRSIAQPFLLQCVLSLFSEDFGLLPNDFFAELIRDCQRGESTYDLFGGLFRQMANPKPAKGGRFKDIRYFNGGLFDEVEALELDKYCLELLSEAANFNWKHVNPAIFGSLFEGTMNTQERHAFGAHFTSESDIQKIVNPSIIRPWKKRIRKAKTLNELIKLRNELSKYRVLDPACGCGNFLYVAYRALKELEMQIIEKIADKFSSSSTRSLGLGTSVIITTQMLGIDIQPIAVEVTKTTLMIAKELAATEWNERINPLMGTLTNLSIDEGLPLDRLDDSIFQGDALLDVWPEFDVVIGNPPFQSKNKILNELGQTYIDTIRAKYPEIPGLADYCVYWFRRAHNEMKEGQFAGFVGTNTIRQNYSREGGLDFIVNNGGTIIDAVETQVWPGDAVVHVSIANWIKGELKGKKQLAVQIGDDKKSPFKYYKLSRISSALSPTVDVTSAKSLLVNSSSNSCHQGQTHGHKGFLVPAEQALKIIKDNRDYSSILKPFLIANELIGSINSQPNRYVIDFRNKDIFEAKQFPILYNIIETNVKPDKKKKAEEEKERNKRACEKNSKARINKHHSNFYKKWWHLAYSRNGLMDKLSKVHRYIACGRVTKRPIFEMISSKISPNDALVVFAMTDDYSFGILQSTVHWEWFKSRCSTLKGDARYTSNTVFDSFPWPQKPTLKQVKNISCAAINLRKIRHEIMAKNKLSLRDLYKTMEETPKNPVSDAQNILDKAVRGAYLMKANDSILEFLLSLNHKLFDLEKNGEEIQAPGLPKIITRPNDFITKDCVKIK